MQFAHQDDGTCYTTGTVYINYYCAPTEELYIKSPQEMADALPDYPEALANAAEIGEACRVELPMGKAPTRTLSS
jgi:DNA polymerase III alpha subunit